MARGGGRKARNVVIFRASTYPTRAHFARRNRRSRIAVLGRTIAAAGGRFARRQPNGFRLLMKCNEPQVWRERTMSARYGYLPIYKAAAPHIFLLSLFSHPPVNISRFEHYIPVNYTKGTSACCSPSRVYVCFLSLCLNNVSLY